jgi:predicted Fe-Mo cluster-binding NifX family protein
MKYMPTQKIAFPSTKEGINGPLILHFGHAEAFTIVEYDSTSKKIINVEVLTNAPHEQGGCMRPVMMLKNSGVNILVVGGIGQRPFMGCVQVEINLFSGKTGTVKENFEAFLENKLHTLSNSSCQH